MRYEILEGKHARREIGMCAMEWVAWLGGEEHTDMPDCIHSNLAIAVMRANDRLEYEDRQRLKPYLARMVGMTTLTPEQSRLAYELHVVIPVTPDRVFGILDRLLPLEHIDIPNPEAAKAMELIPA